MIWIIVLLCIILTVFLVLMLRIRLRIRYSEERGLTVVLTAAGIPLKILYPEIKKTEKIKLRDFTPRALKKKKEKSDKEKLRLRKVRRKNEKNKGNMKRKQTFSDKLEMLRQITRIVRLLLGRFLTYLRTDINCFEITVSGMAAAEAAIVYGAVSQSAAYLFELLDNNTNVHWKNARRNGIYIDFLGERCEASVDIALSLRVWQLLDLFRRAISSMVFAAEKS